MEKEILVLALSDKYKQCCFAGLDLETNKFIRLVDNEQLSHNGIAWERLRDEENNRINVLDIVKVDKLIKAPTAIHSENYSITRESEFSKSKLRYNDEMWNKIPEYEKNDILGSTSPVCYNLTSASHSLELVRFEDGILYSVQSNYNGKIKTKFDFTYYGRRYTGFSVTDPDEYLPLDRTKSYKAGYIVVSIPDDNWSKTNGFYKFVASIFIDQ